VPSGPDPSSRSLFYRHAAVSEAVFALFRRIVRGVNSETISIYTLNSDSHEQQVVNTITGQFDGVVELRETDAGDLEFRVRGFGKRPTPWTEF
jgi:hypothetical protein